MIRSHDGLVARDPIVVRRRVRWGDCDPAQVVYTPQFAHYAVDAIEAFFDEVIGARPIGGVTFPMKALDIEFVRFLSAGDEVDMTVRVGEVRRRTFDLRIEAKRDDQVVFRVRAVPIATDMARRTAVEIPQAVRASIARYAATPSSAMPPHVAP